MSEEPPLHIPVLLNRVIEMLDPKPGERYLDLTAGYGGHARAVLENTKTTGTAVLVDRDRFAIDHLTEFQAASARLLQTDYFSAATALSNDHETFDLILMDIGVSSVQLDRAERGFSFMNEGPLDMRMDQSQGKSAHALIAELSEDHLMQLIMTYGEETRGNARKIAHMIKWTRPGNLQTTHDLAHVVIDALGGSRGKIHPATKTFQALRLAVNDELGQLERTLPLLPGLLNPGGRIAVISFHSLEDRIVKHYFREQANAGFEATLRILTPKPLEQNRSDTNPRARSAKLRAAVKI